MGRIHKKQAPAKNVTMMERSTSHWAVGTKEVASLDGATSHVGLMLGPAPSAVRS